MNITPELWLVLIAVVVAVCTIVIGILRDRDK